MKSSKIVALLACLIGLCLALTGCGGGKKIEEAKASFSGSWSIYSIESNDGTRTVSHEDIALLQSMGQNVTLTFKDDDTVKLDIFGNTMDGTWKVKKNGTGIVEMGAGKVTITIDDEGKLAFSDGKDKLIFTKGAAATKPASSAQTNANSNSDQSADNQEGATSDNGSQTQDDTAATSNESTDATATDNAEGNQAA